MLKKYYEQSGFVGVLDTRAYYIPFNAGEDAFADRKQSGRFTDLDGKWQIKDYESVLDVKDDFYLEETNAEIDVPGCVQYYGYDHFQYTNVNYPFPYNPPYVPNQNPTYHYRKKFDLKKADQKYYLNFEGVDSCFYLYVNDRFVGFSQIAHRQSEFDVTDYLTDGENKLDVLVLKWCMGSYLEDQDKLRFTGIFRDVYLLSRPAGHVVDYKIQTALDGTVTFTLLDGTEATVSLLGEEKKVSAGKTVTFKVKDPILWSAENPYLYDMTITYKDEVIGEKVGIRTTEVSGGVYLLNGKPIKLKGVNRHDFNCRTGASVTVENVIEDMTLMKKLNVNAIRTSHYPNMPEFYQLADKFGFYVMDESDLESHGVVSRFTGYENANYDQIADDPQFMQAILDRQKCNIGRDKNRPSVIIWSLGNECSYGENFARALRWVKANDYRPVHYESLWHYDRKKRGEDYYYSEPVDMVSRMYPPYSWMAEDYFKDPREYRPLVLCEYCHSMGNSPGDFKDYWDIIYSSDRYMGAFVWEWADHGVLYGDKGLRYGGDFGETLHDGNFCMDGIITADRKLTQKSMEMKKAYEPVRFNLQDGKLTVKSLNYFMPVEGTLTLTYKNMGKEVKRENFDLCLQPAETVTFDVDYDHVLIASITLKSDFGLLKKGHEIARGGWTKRVDVYTQKKAAAPLIADEGRYITVKTASASYKLDKTNAAVVSIEGKNGEILESPIELNLWRAPTDNDRNVKNDWIQCRYYEIFSEVRRVDVENNVVRFTGHIAPVKLEPVSSYTLTYEFYDNAVSVKIDYEFASYAKYPPRVGLKTKLSKKFDKVKYYGFGPYEAYIDKRIASVKDVYEDKVKDLMVSYVRPQENGSHYGTEFMEITDGKTVLRAEDNFSFSALPYSAETLTDCAHDWELPKSDGTYLSLDFFMSGIGSHSCGPVLDEKWEAPKKGKGSITLIIK